MAVVQGRLYAVGGFDGVRRLGSVECYDPFSNTWGGERKEDMEEKGRKAGDMRVAQGRSSWPAPRVHLVGKFGKIRLTEGDWDQVSWKASSQSSGVWT